MSERIENKVFKGFCDRCGKEIPGYCCTTPAQFRRAGTETFCLSCWDKRETEIFEALKTLHKEGFTVTAISKH